MPDNNNSRNIKLFTETRMHII